jgi:fatty acid desaturase
VEPEAIRALTRLRSVDEDERLSWARSRFMVRALRVRSARERRRRRFLVGAMVLVSGATVGRWLPVPVDLALGVGALLVLGLAYRT